MLRLPQPAVGNLQWMQHAAQKGWECKSTEIGDQVANVMLAEPDGNIGNISVTSSVLGTSERELKLSVKHVTLLLSGWMLLSFVAVVCTVLISML